MGFLKSIFILLLIIILSNCKSSFNLRSNNEENYKLPNFAWISHKLSYHNDLLGNLDNINFRTIESDDKSFRCNIITLSTPIENKIDIVVVFRGTKVSMMQNVFADMNISPKKLDGICDFCYVHRGFYDAFETIKNKVMFNLQEEVLLQTKQGKIIQNLYYTGHSLGGGLANIGLYEFLNEKWWDKNSGLELISNVSLFTFGCPRVGNIIFRDFMNRKILLKYNLRVVYGFDIVPDLLAGAPLSNYRHIGDFVHFPKNEFDYPIVIKRDDIEKYEKDEDIFDILNIKERIEDHGKYSLLNPKGIEDAIKKLYNN